MFKRAILGTALALVILTVGFVQLADQPFKNVEASEIQQQIQKSSLQVRLEMLELSVMPTTAEEAVQTFAKAVKLRNGGCNMQSLLKRKKPELRRVSRKVIGLRAFQVHGLKHIKLFVKRN
ncbi:hypothetical protein MKZ01_07850 [Lysinibacillus endophyticus]|uniref:Uncharacterized protein n=1 Tax=Ureibacillus endophyticus TaxID=1978490 RepID=A0A494Z2H9_9BACL|nr:hypothetical protein [Lysinibacillus endophyticus]RKQ16696.1 hypothetical protein D8M03_09360 [Lysinibacillus endophyticus]